ncbi:protein trichome birefringence isoform X2 [Populus trichocarpa]|uniref:protein trichome birefringence isoform X2 n=1 Tax=Populus trichocarpa TaxID=3694 RepID=UPI0022797981|nr:protein trichome birefringence isoform X2 [Populus trichocarpa]
MADTTASKHLSSISGGNIITDMKNLSSLLKTRRTVTFAYGFMFAFVAFTIFLAFSPSPNSSSPWFTNIFSTSTSTASSDSHRSQFSSIFSYFLPNNTSAATSQEQGRGFSSMPSQNTTRSNDTLSPNSRTEVKDPISVKNLTQSTVLQPNRTSNSSVVIKEPAFANNQTQTAVNSDKGQVLKPNQTTVANPTTIQVAANQSENTPTKSGSLVKEGSGNQDKGDAGKTVSSNFTASLVKKQSNATKQSNETNSGKEVKQGFDNRVQNLANCDFFDGEWVKDDSYPLYKPGSCSLIDEQFNCIINGRPDKDYQKYKWKPKGCTLPRLNPRHMLDMLRGKRLVFVGDSLNRNMWESLVCILKGSVKDQSKVFEVNGRHHFRGEASYSFLFKDYNCTIDFFVSPFLVQEWEMHEKDGSMKETLRLDLVGRSSSQYKSADIIVFNTGHWWTHDKTSKGKDYYQEGNHVYNELNVLEAFRKALTTWARWVDANVDPMKSLVFFRGYSASHFSGGQWNSGGQCDSEAEPIKNVTYLRQYPPKMLVLEKVLRNMKAHVTYLNVTQMTDYRKDGHPSVYRKQNLSPEERKSPLHFQDCSHWCLPGVPDAWNEILYANLLVNEKQKQQAQKRHR